MIGQVFRTIARFISAAITGFMGVLLILKLTFDPFPDPEAAITAGQVIWGFIFGVSMIHSGWSLIGSLEWPDLGGGKRVRS
jgi:hypothetical protein